MLQLVICALNWECLGHPIRAPSGARIGDPSSAQQHRVIDHLESQLDHLLRVPSFIADDLGRAADKLASLSQVIKELPQDNLRDVDLLDWAAALHNSFFPYEHPKPRDLDTERAGPSHASCPREAVSAPQQPVRFINFRTGTALPVTASRIKWSSPPSFNPAPYLDPMLRHAFANPEFLRKPPGDWPKLPPARIHCSRAELLKLGELWDKMGSVRITPIDQVDWNEAVGISAVSKSAARDRLIINPCVANSRSQTISRFSKSLAPGCLLTMLSLEPHLGFRVSADDLTDYYYTFQVSKKRAIRNSLRCAFAPSELAHFAAAEGLVLEGPQVLSLNTMAMGDSLAVEVGQAAHFQVLRQHVGSLLPYETLLYRHPIPKTNTVELLSIDDHVSLQKVPLVDLPLEPPLLDTAIFNAASVAYKHTGLVLNDDKKRRNLTQACVLGAEVDGIRGLVGPPRDRVLSLALLSACLAKKGYATRELLDRIVGCWVHALMFRRPVFAVIDVLFRQGMHLPRNQVFRLSSQARNELQMLACLVSTLVCDLRATYDPQLYCLDASPYAGAVCATTVGSSTTAELWRHGELRGYHTRLESTVSALLTEKGISHEGEKLFGECTAAPPEFQHQARWDPFVPKPLREGLMYDAIVLCTRNDSWGLALESSGLKVLFALGDHGRTAASSLCVSAATTRELIALAARRVVREWHCAPSWPGLGPLQSGGREQQCLSETRSARRVAFVMAVAVRCGQFVSIEQPRRARTFGLECYRTLVQLGCIVTSVCYCSFGSPYLRATSIMHNKPWLCSLESCCSCCRHGGPDNEAQHWPGEGVFNLHSIASFTSACRPSLERVYSREPELGESFASFGAVLPLGLSTRISAGSLAAARGFVPGVPLEFRRRAAQRFEVELGLELLASCSHEASFPERDWHEDPEWISELCRSLRFHELFRYAFKKPGHINVNEARVYKTWVKSLARRSQNVRAAALLDSRVTIGAAAKGRSSSFAISRILQGCLGYVLGSGLYSSLLHVYSGDNVADNPSRGKDVAEPSRGEPRWLQELRAGDPAAFEAVTSSARIPRNPARWLRFLLLLAGDIERNPGPAPVPPTPRGPLDLQAGFATSTPQKMTKSFAGFKAWIVEHVCQTPESVFANAETTAMALRAYGLHLYQEGLPRYLFVYAITAVQDAFPQHFNFLTAAWQIDKKWQRAEPGECRPVLPVAAVRASISVALLWGWNRWSCLVIIGFLAMLHPSELVLLTRRDLVFPADNLGHTTSLFVHLRSPKTSRFARRQHGRIDDAAAIAFLFTMVGGLSRNDRIYPASLHSFRRQWDAVLGRLGLPVRAADRGATPGVLRGSGATWFYICTENIPLLAWRGRWARVKTLEYYLQEVAAQVLLAELDPVCRARIQLLDKAADSLLCHFSGATQY